MGGNQKRPMKGGIPKSRSEIIQHGSPEPNKVNTMTPQNLLFTLKKVCIAVVPVFIGPVWRSNFMTIRPHKQQQTPTRIEPKIGNPRRNRTETN
jgi:hypothetical protein